MPTPLVSATRPSGDPVYLTYPLVRQAGKEVVDVYVDVSDSVTDTHGAYWDDGTFQREVAERW